MKKLLNKFNEKLENLPIVRTLQYTALATIAVALIQLIYILFQGAFTSFGFNFSKLANNLLAITIRIPAVLFQPIILLAFAELLKLKIAQKGK